ncbi:hypothetical protein, partial [Vibrio sp. V26_P1S5P106]|uniref:hypothetical protein n=2 Tax=Vibrio TaxID=662 RepID=UPI001F21CEC5
FLIIYLMISSCCIVSFNGYAFKPIGSGTIIFSGAVVETTCSASLNQISCGDLNRLKETEHFAIYQEQKQVIKTLPNKLKSVHYTADKTSLMVTVEYQ